MCGIEVKIGPKQSKELAERKKTKGKTNGWAERGDENNCSTRDAEWNHLPSTYPSTSLVCQ